MPSMIMRSVLSKGWTVELKASNLLMTYPLDYLSIRGEQDVPIRGSYPSESLLVKLGLLRCQETSYTTGYRTTGFMDS